MGHNVRLSNHLGISWYYHINFTYQNRLNSPSSLRNWVETWTLLFPWFLGPKRFSICHIIQTWIKFEHRPQKKKGSQKYNECFLHVPHSLISLKSHDVEVFYSKKLLVKTFPQQSINQKDMEAMSWDSNTRAWPVGRKKIPQPSPPPGEKSLVEMGKKHINEDTKTPAETASLHL